MKKLFRFSVPMLALLLLVGRLTGCSSKTLQINLENGYDCRIESDIDEVFISGNAEGKTLYNVCITVANRTKKLIINLENVNFNAEQDRPAIFCESLSFQLTVRFTGQCKIVGGNGSFGKNGENGIYSWHGADGLPGQVALSCGKVVFEGTDSESALTLKGGDGGNGGNGGHFDTLIMGIIDKPHGGAGGDAAAALICKNSPLNYDNVNFIAGGCGNGGNGGWCGICWIPVYGKAGTNGKAAKTVICI